MTPDASLPPDFRDELGPLHAVEDAKRWLEVLGHWTAAGDVHPDGAALAVLRRVRAWRWERESADDDAGG